MWVRKFFALAEIAWRGCPRIFNWMIWALMGSVLTYYTVWIHHLYFLSGHLSASGIAGVVICDAIGLWNTALLIIAMFSWLLIIQFTVNFLYLCYKYDGSAWPAFRQIEKWNAGRMADLRKRGEKFRADKERERQEEITELEKSIAEIKAGSQTNQAD